MEEIKKVLVNAAQSFSESEKAQGRANLGIRGNGVPQFPVVRNPNDSSNTYRYVKVAEIDTDTVNNYCYGYEIGLDFVLTNGGYDGDSSETGHLDIALTLRRNINTWYITGGWSTYTQSAYWGRTIESAMVLRQRHDAGNVNEATKYEIWLKVNNNFTVMTMMGVSCPLNTGSSTYASYAYYPTNLENPWTIPSGCQTLTTTEPTMQSGDGYFYDTETFVPIATEINGWYRRKHTATLEYHGTYGADGEEWYITNLINGAVNHVLVDNQNNVICKLYAVAPTIRNDEEYDYAIVFDCTNSSGNAQLDIQNAVPKIEERISLNHNGEFLRITGENTASDADPAEIRVVDSSSNNKYLRIEQANYYGNPEGKTLAGPYVVTGVELVTSNVTKQMVDFSGAKTYQARILGHVWRMDTY